MSNGTFFVDTNIWLYRLFEDLKMLVTERERKRSIAINITSTEVIISTQVNPNLSPTQVWQILG